MNYGKAIVRYKMQLWQMASGRSVIMFTTYPYTKLLHVHFLCYAQMHPVTTRGYPTMSIGQNRFHPFYVSDCLLFYRGYHPRLVGVINLQIDTVFFNYMVIHFYNHGREKMQSYYSQENGSLRPLKLWTPTLIACASVMNIFL